MDVTHLLSAFARKRLYTFPPMSDDPLDPRRDCHWTAFNFFNDPPDDHFCDMHYTEQIVSRDYQQVTGPWRLGDIIVLYHPNGQVMHSAVYLADDLVFTKNGGAKVQPWIYMRLDDMLANYTACCPPGQQPRMDILRRKGA